MKVIHKGVVMEDGYDLKKEVAKLGITEDEMAGILKLHPDYFQQIIKGLRIKKGFAVKIQATIKYIANKDSDILKP